MTWIIPAIRLSMRVIKRKKWEALQPLRKVGKKETITEKSRQLKNESIQQTFGNGFWGTYLSTTSDLDMHWKGVKGYAQGRLHQGRWQV